MLILRSSRYLKLSCVRVQNLFCLEKCGPLRNVEVVFVCLFVYLVFFVCLFVFNSQVKERWVYVLTVSLFVYLSADSPIIGHTYACGHSVGGRESLISNRFYITIIKMAAKCEAVLVICGGVLVHLTLGTLYTFGKSPLFQKYIRNFQYTAW